MAYHGGKLHPMFDPAPNDVAMRNMVRIAIVAAQDIAVENTPVFTGYLRESWRVEDNIARTMTAFGLAWQGTWINDVEYAEYVEYGTGLFGPEHRKYLILPKEPGGTLHWVDRLTGEDRFAKAVLHPGSPGHHMLAISGAVLDATWTKLVRPAMNNWVRQVEDNARQVSRF